MEYEVKHTCLTRDGCIVAKRQFAPRFEKQPAGVAAFTAKANVVARRARAVKR